MMEDGLLIYVKGIGIYIYASGLPGAKSSRVYRAGMLKSRMNFTVGGGGHCSASATIYRRNGLLPICFEHVAACNAQSPSY
jgi:hypothetical protein